MADDQKREAYLPAEGGPWRHCRWFEPGHEAIPKTGTIGPVRAQGGATGAACVTCGEAIVPRPAEKCVGLCGKGADPSACPSGCDAPEPTP